MIVREIVRKIVELLERESMDYMVVGGIASMHHAVPQARMELFTGTMRWVIEVRGTVYKIEFFLLGGDQHHLEEFKRRQRVWLPLIERETWLATAEDMIVQKLRWARPQDVADVADILSVSRGALDFPYIEKWCREHKTWERLQDIRRSVEESLTPPKVPPPDL